MKLITTSTLSALLLLSACGGGGGSTSSKHSDPARDNQDDVVVDIDIDAGLEGQYLAVFETMNTDITGKVTGAFTFSRDKLEDEVVADVRLNNGGQAVIHAQNIRVGFRCPTIADDTNGDGFVDAQEGEAVYGRIFIPLDGDLSSQSSKDGLFPVGDTYGNYIWARVTKFSTFIKDLRITEHDGYYVKLNEREPMPMEGLAVVIHGVDTAVALPDTVKGVGRLDRHAALPIACGTIGKVLGPPGEVDDGNEPVEPETPERLELF